MGRFAAPQTCQSLPSAIQITVAKLTSQITALNSTNHKHHDSIIEKGSESFRVLVAKLSNRHVGALLLMVAETPRMLITKIINTFEGHKRVLRKDVEVSK